MSDLVIKQQTPLNLAIRAGELLHPPLVGAEYMGTRLPAPDTIDVGCNATTPFLAIRLFAVFNSPVEANQISVNYYLTHTTLCIEIGYLPSDPTIGSNTWYLDCEYHNANAGSITEIHTSVHDKDPETSRGTVTTVQH
jgi:hypothetical protein